MGMQAESRSTSRSERHVSKEITPIHVQQHQGNELSDCHSMNDFDDEDILAEMDSAIGVIQAAVQLARSTGDQAAAMFAEHQNKQQQQQQLWRHSTGGMESTQHGHPHPDAQSRRHAEANSKLQQAVPAEHVLLFTPRGSSISKRPSWSGGEPSNTSFKDRQDKSNVQELGGKGQGSRHITNHVGKQSKPKRGLLHWLKSQARKMKASVVNHSVSVSSIKPAMDGPTHHGTQQATDDAVAYLAITVPAGRAINDSHPNSAAR